jgi:hypothetical protein
MRNQPHRTSTEGGSPRDLEIYSRRQRRNAVRPDRRRRRTSGPLASLVLTNSPSSNNASTSGKAKSIANRPSSWFDSYCGRSKEPFKHVAGAAPCYRRCDRTSCRLMSGWFQPAATISQSGNLRNASATNVPRGPQLIYPGEFPDDDRLDLISINRLPIEADRCLRVVFLQKGSG